MYKAIRSLVFFQEPEKTHKMVLATGKYLSGSRLREVIGLLYDFQDYRLESDFCGIHFPSHLGLAAGFDKNGEMIDILPYLGFGFTEIGSVTAEARDGNSGPTSDPRMFRLPEDKALINRMGLNNYGADEIAGRLTGKDFEIPVGINIAKTNDPEILGDKAIDDFCYSFERLYPVGDYTTINISCPNTEDGRTFEDKAALGELLSALKEREEKYAKKKPVLVKISADVSYKELDDILEVSESHDINGYVIGNTSLRRNGLRTPYEKLKEIGKGGLSGPPIRKITTELIGYVCSHLENPNIIGAGGISSAEDAYEKILAGASLIQIYTGLIYEGPALVKKINKGLLNLMKKDGSGFVSDAVGKSSCVA